MSQTRQTSGLTTSTAHFNASRSSNSPSIKALQLEYSKLQKEPVEGFTVKLGDDSNLYKWHVGIFGPPDTLYEGGYFKADMEFPTTYPFAPPKVRFLTRMWHPNIYENGEVCISILHPPTEDPQSGEHPSERWNPTQNVRTILMSIISLLNEPNCSSPANVDASVMYRKYKENKDNEYETTVRRQVNESKIIAEQEGIVIPKTLDDYVAPSRAGASGNSNGKKVFSLSSYEDDDPGIDDNDDHMVDMGGDEDEDDCYNENMSSDSVGLLSSPSRSNSPLLTEPILNEYEHTIPIFDDYTNSSFHQPRSPSKRQLTIEESLITTNDPKRLCHSNLRESIDLPSLASNSINTPLSSCSSNSTDCLSIPSSPPTPPLSADVLNWLAVFLAMSNDDRSRATEALIRTCSSNTLHLNHIKNQIEPYFQRDFIRDLPRELALHILKYLPANDLARASRTCRAWYEACNDVLIWKNLCQTKAIPLKIRPTIFDTIIENRWKRSYACHKHLEHVWQHESPLPEPVVFRGHEDFVITCLQFDGKRIVSGSDDNSLKIWSVATGQCEQTLIGHNGGVWCSEMTDDLIVSGSTDRTIRVWNINTGVCQYVLYGHTSTVRCLALHGDIVVSGSRDATVRVWNIRTGERLHMLSGHTAAVRCVCYNGKYVVSGAYDHTIRVWLPDQERCVHTLEGHTNRVYSLVFDGKHIVSGSLDCMIRVWDVEQGTCLQQLTGHLSLTSGMQLRGNILVSGNADSTVKIWNIDSGKCLHTLAGKNKHASAVTWVQVVLNYVVSSGDDGTVKLWDLETGDFIRNLVTLESHGNGGVVWRIKCTDSALVCAAGSRNSTEDTKVIMLDFDRTTICS